MKIRIGRLRRFLVEALDDERHENVVCLSCEYEFDTRDHYPDEPEEVECPECGAPLDNPNWSGYSPLGTEVPVESMSEMTVQQAADDFVGLLPPEVKVLDEEVDKYDGLVKITLGISQQVVRKALRLPPVELRDSWRRLPFVSVGSSKKGLELHSASQWRIVEQPQQLRTVINDLIVDVLVDELGYAVEDRSHGEAIVGFRCKRDSMVADIGSSSLSKDFGDPLLLVEVAFKPYSFHSKYL